jgi:trehalose synthase-fused probable maltokinase
MKAFDALARHGLKDAGDKVGGYIGRQRWFSGKDREIRRADILDAVSLREGEVPVLVVIARVELDDGSVERYHVPLAARADAATVWEGNVVGTGERDGRQVVFYDALADGEAAWAFWEVMAAGTELEGERGRLVARGNLGELLPGEGPAAIRPLGREQSNTSLVRAEREVLKVYRRLTAGLSPEVEMTDALVSQGFTHVLASLGTLEYHGEGEEPAQLAVVQPYLSGATEGWTLALTSLRDLLAAAADSGSPPGLPGGVKAEEADGVTPEEAVLGQGSSFIPETERIGELTARMHLAMSGADLPPDLRPAVVTRDTLRAWVAEMRADLERVSGEAADAARTLLPVKAAIAQAFDAVGELEDGGLAIRTHGDYHLGQLVRTNDGWTVLDFEGEPDRELAARRTLQSPLRDVAGMMRSLDYAAAIELRDWSGPDKPDFAELSARAQAWARLNREAFWGAYRAAVRDTSLLPADDAVAALLHAFELQKAVYELGYELGHRPDWAGIPLGFLAAVGQR